MTFPSILVISFRKPVNNWVDEVILNNAEIFDKITSIILQILLKFERFFRFSPWWVIVLLFAMVTFLAGRSIRVTLIVCFNLMMIGVLGMWDKGMQTLALISICMALILVVGIPLGVLMSRSERAQTIINPILDMMQTMPSFVYLVPAIMLFGLGKVPAILATLVYAVVPLIRLTDLGIRQVNKEVLEAAVAFGDSTSAILWRIKLPLSMPSILMGINQSIMMALAMVVIASLVGARGLGEPILFAIQRLDVGRGVQGGLAITFLAIVFDRFTQGVARRWKPPE